MTNTVLDGFRLDGRRAIVTGASSGLGVAFAQALAEAGADVAVGARRIDRLAETEALVAAQGRRAFSAPLEVSDPASCQRFVQDAAEALGGVEILVNNAGVGTAVPAIRETPDEFRRVIDVNLNGCYWMAQASAGAMNGVGSIINVSSVLGFKSADLPQAAYSASKAGLLALTRDLAQQWTGRRGIRVNSLVPGFFASEMTDDYEAGYLERQVENLPAGRLGESSELAAAAVFLASDASSYMTGSTLVVDGGFTVV